MATPGPQAELSPEIIECAREMFTVLKSYLGSAHSLGVLVAGKTGVGKSSLINSLIGGAQVAEEGSSVRSVSNQIISYTTSFNTPVPDKENEVTTLTAWDSPGFGDIFISEKDREVRLSELRFAIDKAHVFLYCFKITERITGDDIDGIVKITKELDPSIWRKAVFALTFANEIQIPKSDRRSVDQLPQFLTEKVEEWKQVIYEVLETRAGVPEDILRDISVVPVGYLADNPPDRNEWYTPFWIELFKKTRETGKPALLRLTWSRFDCQEDKVLNFNEQMDESLPVNLFKDDKLLNLIDVGDLEQYLPTSSHQSFSEMPAQASSTGNRFPRAHQVPSRSPIKTPALPPPIVVSQNTAPLLGAGQQETSLYVDIAPEEPYLEVRGSPRMSAQELRSTTRSETAVPMEDEKDEKHPRLKKAAKIGATIGSTSTAGALVGLLIGIVGGPIGMAIGASAGFVVGGGIGAGGLIAKELAKFMKKKQLEKKQEAAENMGRDNPTINC